MKIQKGVIGLPILIAIVFGVAVFGGGAYFLVQKQSFKQNEIATSTPQVIVSDSIQTNTELKTYTNSQYGFSIDYPATIFINDAQPIPPYRGYDSFPFFPDTLGRTIVQLSLFPNSEMRSANSIAIGATADHSIIATCGSFNLTGITETRKSLAGENFLYNKIIPASKAGPEHIVIRYKILKNNVCYEITESVNYTGKPELDTHEEFLKREAQLESVVQSFRFTTSGSQTASSQKPPVDGQ